MSARSKARKRALDILFQADVRGEDVALTLAAEARRAASEPAREASWLYAREIVDGVIDNAPAIDEAITAAAKGWTLVRMPAVDRALLRIGTWEIVYNDGVPADDSGAFVHGVLGRVARGGETATGKLD